MQSWWIACHMTESLLKQQALCIEVLMTSVPVIENTAWVLRHRYYRLCSL